MQNLTERVHALNNLVAEFRYPEAFDPFYNKSLLNCENEQALMVGLPAEREAMKHFLNAITNPSKDWGHRRYTQLTVQR